VQPTLCLTNKRKGSQLISSLTKLAIIIPQREFIVRIQSKTSRF
jgi:hypothetical protein